MRRFSQRNSLVTLSDINITPLLDLAFVLLIIFVITTPFLEGGLQLNLPEGGRSSTTRVKQEDLQVVEIEKTGRLHLNGRPVSIDELERALVAESRRNPNMVVSIRADQEAMTKHFYPVIDRCTRNNITRVNLKTLPTGR
ncbi:MAG: biopolymer transporter ExbD [Verrucomicrobia bacterium]|nr:biopolymer transporter ExbD [Verrucomicrobiota bacterium]